MALAAVHLSVLAGQREPRTLVRESCHRFPALLTVAFRARFLELSAVLILVTTQTVPPQSQERAVLHACGVGSDPLVFQMCRVVTRCAADPRVFPFQTETSPLMIELGRVEPHEPELPPMMLFVALHAFVGDKAAMQSRPPRDPLGNIRMTGQALLVVDVLAERVTRRTVANPLQCCMRRRKLPRRDLGPGIPNAQDQKEQPDDHSCDVHVTTPTNSRTRSRPPHE